MELVLTMPILTAGFVSHAATVYILVTDVMTRKRPTSTSVLTEWFVAGVVVSKDSDQRIAVSVREV
jgi:hypothetical protein